MRLESRRVSSLNPICQNLSICMVYCFKVFGTPQRRLTMFWIQSCLTMTHVFGNDLVVRVLGFSLVATLPIVVMLGLIYGYQCQRVDS